MSDPMRFHIPHPAHVVADDAHRSCAYTQKARRLSAMLKSLGHEVYFYCVEGSEADATEVVPVVSNEYRRLWYADNDNPLNQYRFDTADEYHQTFNRRVVEEIERRRGDRDFLCLPWGFGHYPIAQALGEKVIPVESGVGYPQCCLPHNRVFESETWRAWVYGKEGKENGDYRDTVIPNAYHPEEFEYREQKGSRFLFLGRLVKRKGLAEVIEATRQAGVELVVAGQGDLANVEGLDLRAPHVEFVGYAGPERVRELMAEAKALLAYTLYLGPFEGVSIEAAFSGTPTITSDWGCYTENVLQGVTGFRCSTMAELVAAIRRVDEIKPADCRAWAIANFTCARAAHQYECYFRRLHDLYQTPEDLNWRRRWWPEGAR